MRFASKPVHANKRAAFVLACIMAIGASACEDVEFGEYRPVIAAPNAEQYEFDLALFSEWNGEIQPDIADEASNTKVNICISDEHIRPQYKVLITQIEKDENQNIILNLSGQSEDPVKVQCIQLSQSAAEHYHITNNCLGAKFGSTENIEELYYCMLNLNVMDTSKIDYGHGNSELDYFWTDIFPAVNNNTTGFVNVPICARNDDEVFYLRPNEVISTQDISIKNAKGFAKIANPDDAEHPNYKIDLLNHAIFGTPDVDDKGESVTADVLCSFDASNEHCFLDGEMAYACVTRKNGATGFQNIWNNVFQRPNVPMFIASNGDNTGMTNDVSSTFDDRPTIQLLSALGLDVDAFGNHVFDDNIKALQSIVDESNYPYVVSNFKYVPNNIQGVSQFSIMQVPEHLDQCEDRGDKGGTCCKSVENPDGQDCLNVAFVGVLDQTVKDYVFPGRFGNLEMTDYCDVKYALQEAYNLNARAFFVLAHLSTSSDYPMASENGELKLNTSGKRRNVFRLLQTLFNLEDDDNTICREDHLIIPAYRLQDKKEFCPALCDAKKNPNAQADCCDQCGCNPEFNDEENYRRTVIREMNHEIFDGIIGILAETGDSHLVGFTSGDTQKMDGLVHFSMDNSTFDQNNEGLDLAEEPYDFEATEDGKTQNLLRNLDNAGDHLPYVNQSITKDIFGFTQIGSVGEGYFENVYQNSSKHPIWVLQIPDSGTYTANLRVKVKRGDSKYDIEKGFAKPYISEVESALVLPTIQSPVDVPEYKPSICRSSLLDLVKTDKTLASMNYSDDDVAELCAKHETLKAFGNEAEACSCYNYFMRQQTVDSNDDAAKSNDGIEACEMGKHETHDYFDCVKFRACQQNAENDLETCLNAAKYTQVCMPDDDILMNAMQSCLCTGYLKGRFDKLSGNDTVESLQTNWICLYDGGALDSCDGQNMCDYSSDIASCTFKERQLLDFDKLDIPLLSQHIKGMNKDDIRSETTFVGSFVPDIMLTEANRSLGSNEAPYDLFLMNAGAINQAETFARTDYTQSRFSKLIPFKNTFKSVKLTPSAFVNFIEVGLPSDQKMLGAYPLMAGVTISTASFDGYKHVVEMWKNRVPSDADYERDASKLLKEPLYQLLDIYRFPTKAESDAVESCAEFWASENAKSNYTKIYGTETQYDTLGYCQNSREEVEATNDHSFCFEARTDSAILNQNKNLIINQDICRDASNDGRFYNIVYRNPYLKTHDLTAYPMKLHISKEMISTNQQDTYVCKCYLTAINVEESPVTHKLEELSAYEKDLQVIYGTEWEKCISSDDHSNFYYITPGKEKETVTRELKILTTDFITTGGDNYSLPKYIDPAIDDKVPVTVSIPPNLSDTGKALSRFFSTTDSEENHVCRDLTEASMDALQTIDGRTLAEFVWDNAYCRHMEIAINDNQSSSTSNCVSREGQELKYIMQRSIMEPTKTAYGQASINALESTLSNNANQESGKE